MPDPYTHTFTTREAAEGPRSLRLLREWQASFMAFNVSCDRLEQRISAAVGLLPENSKATREDVIKAALTIERERATPTQTEAEAEVERLYQRIKDRDVAMGLFLKDLRATQDREIEANRTIADLRAKLDALVGAVDGLSNGAIRHAMGDLLRHTSIPDHCLATLRLAADAARQPTEDR